jgi:hypothetical protein
VTGEVFDRLRECTVGEFLIVEYALSNNYESAIPQ